MGTTLRRDSIHPGIFDSKLFCEEGQLLARLDKGAAEVAFHVAQAEFQVARARVSEAEAVAQRATESLERTKRLADKSLASHSALESARSEMAKARAGVQASRAERAAALKRASLRGHQRKINQLFGILFSRHAENLKLTAFKNLFST